MLIEAVKSAEEQTLEDLEIIVVDDGSTDSETLKILQDLERRGMQILRQSNSGVSTARNTGVTKAAGDFILCLDDDDRIAPTYAETASSLLAGDSTLGVVYSEAEYFGQRSGPWVLDDFSPARLAMGNCVFSAAFFRRRDWDLIGGFDEDLRYFEDYDFWIRICMLGRAFERLPHILFYYRYGHNSVLRSTTGVGDFRPDITLAKQAAHDFILQKNLRFFEAHVRELHAMMHEYRAEAMRWRRLYGAIDRRFGFVAQDWLPRARAFKKRLVHR